MSVTLFPLTHLLSSTQTAAHHRCQHLVHLSFRAFIRCMRTLGILTCEVIGQEKLQSGANCLIVANHPSLIDIVFIIAMLPKARCVVKRAVWSNPFMAGVVWATGYIPNDDPVRFIEACIACLGRGESLVVFPESTRTVPGQPLQLRRGAASVIAKSRRPFVPIAISTRPTTLTKADKWYQIPASRPHFTIVVGDSIDPAPAIVDGEASSLASRRINRLLRSVLIQGVELHASHSR